MYFMVHVHKYIQHTVHTYIHNIHTHRAVYFQRQMKTWSGLGQKKILNNFTQWGTY